MNTNIKSRAGSPHQTFQVLLFLKIVAILAIFSTANIASADTKISTLYEILAKAKTELEGREAESALWEYWFDQAPSSEARMLLDAAIERREAYDFEAAENKLNELVDLAPHYAEGYNQRAFIRFLRENFVDAKDDLDKTLTIEPDHFGALAGLYLIHSRNAEQGKAFDALRRAVTIHPWLKERSGLPKALWPESYKNIHTGQDI